MKTELEKLLSLVFARFIIFVSAQKQLITGTVPDHSQPLPGATFKANKPLIYPIGKNEDHPEQVEYYGIRCNLGIKLNF